MNVDLIHLLGVDPQQRVDHPAHSAKLVVPVRFDRQHAATELVVDACPPCSQGQQPDLLFGGRPQWPGILRPCCSPCASSQSACRVSNTMSRPAGVIHAFTHRSVRGHSLKRGMAVRVRRGELAVIGGSASGFGTTRPGGHAGRKCSAEIRPVGPTPNRAASRTRQVVVEGSSPAS